MSTEALPLSRLVCALYLFVGDSEDPEPITILNGQLTYTNESDLEWVDEDGALVLPHIVTDLASALAAEGLVIVPRELVDAVNRIFPESRDPANDEEVCISGHDFHVLRAALEAQP